jgi:hypothetical protein
MRRHIILTTQAESLLAYKCQTTGLSRSSALVALITSHPEFSKFVEISKRRSPAPALAPAQHTAPASAAPDSDEPQGMTYEEYAKERELEYQAARRAAPSGGRERPRAAQPPDKHYSQWTKVEIEVWPDDYQYRFDMEFVEPDEPDEDDEPE